MKKVLWVILCLAILGAVWIGFIRWYYYTDEGGERDYLTEEFKQSVRVETTPIGGGFHMLRIDSVNVLVFASEEAAVVVDTGLDWSADRLIETVEALHPADVTYVFNTHAHGDHTGGNPKIHAHGSEILAHPNAMVAMQRSGASDPLLLPAVPDRTVDEGDTFEIGGQRITVLHLPFAHTDGDIALLFQPANLLAVGDVIHGEGLPYIGRPDGASLADHLAAQDRLIAMMDDETIVVPGHGPVMNKSDVIQINRDLRRTESYITFLANAGIPLQLIPYFHPLYAIPISHRRGFAWDRFWVGLVYDGIVSRS